MTKVNLGLLVTIALPTLFIIGYVVQINNMRSIIEGDSVVLYAWLESNCIPQCALEDANTFHFLTLGKEDDSGNIIFPRNDDIHDKLFKDQQDQWIAEYDQPGRGFTGVVHHRLTLSSGSEWIYAKS